MERVFARAGRRSLRGADAGSWQRSTRWMRRCLCYSAAEPKGLASDRGCTARRDVRRLRVSQSWLRRRTVSRRRTASAAMVSSLCCPPLGRCPSFVRRTSASSNSALPRIPVNGLFNSCRSTGRPNRERRLSHLLLVCYKEDGSGTGAQPSHVETRIRWRSELDWAPCARIRDWRR